MGYKPEVLSRMPQTMINMICVELNFAEEIYNISDSSKVTVVFPVHRNDL